VALVARGIPYRLTLSDAVRANGDGAPLADAGTAHAVWIQGRGDGAVFPVPNPVRPADSEVVFAETAPGTRIEIFDLEGQRVRVLDGGTGGAVRWDLRGPHGSRVASGVYLYIVRDPSGAGHGRLVIIR